MSRLEGYSTWDASANSIGVGPVQAPPAGSTDTWYATYIDFENNFNGFTHEVKATFDSENLVINRSLVSRDYSNDNTLLLEYMRTARNDLLSQSDWTQTTDSPLSAEKRTEWQFYRQQLRDLPALHVNTTSLDDVTYPTPPE
tara:strand:+ start:176 stop:601 length:426 start_codon:yes stop_codon:yes gene_type:complete